MIESPSLTEAPTKLVLVSSILHTKKAPRYGPLRYLERSLAASGIPLETFIPNLSKHLVAKTPCVLLASAPKLFRTRSLIAVNSVSTNSLTTLWFS